jgi:hypothetical protein
MDPALSAFAVVCRMPLPGAPWHAETQFNIPNAGANIQPVTRERLNVRSGNEPRDFRIRDWLSARS